MSVSDDGARRALRRRAKETQRAKQKREDPSGSDHQGSVSVSVVNTRPGPSRASASVCIAGGGIGGLSLALWLLRSGVRVRLHEAFSRPGGLLWTRMVGGGMAEHGPSYFLESHFMMRNLLREVGIQEEKADPLAGNWVLDGKQFGQQELRRFFERLLEDCDPDLPLEFCGRASEARVFPFWEDIKYGTPESARDFFTAALRPVGGYSALVRSLVDAIDTIDGDAIICKSRVESARPAGDHAVAVRVSKKPAEEHICSQLVLAIPPQALLRLQGPREVTKPLHAFARARVWVRSVRVYVVLRQPPERLQSLWRDGIRHFFWRDSPMGWVILEGPCGKGWRLLFYLDGERADRAYRLLRFTRKPEALARDMMLHFTSRTFIGAFEIAEVSVGGAHGPSAMHPRIGAAPAQDGVDLHPRILLAGEAAKPDMYGWTEASLLASRAVFQTIRDGPVTSASKRV